MTQPDDPGPFAYDEIVEFSAWKMIGWIVGAFVVGILAAALARIAVAVF